LEALSCNSHNLGKIYPSVVFTDSIHAAILVHRAGKLETDGLVSACGTSQAGLFSVRCANKLKGRSGLGYLFAAIAGSALAKACWNVTH
jgi:hypothetical protein